MPRALTEKEKCMQCQRLIEKGKAAVISYGMRKVSVDDIAKAAGMAKGTFYQHFESKEKYLFALIERIHHEAFEQAKQILIDENMNSILTKETAHTFLQKLFALPEMVFFIQNEHDITLLMDTSPNEDAQNFKESEELLFAEIISLVGLNPTNIKPGVVHNLIHTLFIVQASDFMVEKDLAKTLDLIMDSLLSYLFEDAA